HCEYELDNAKIAHLWGQGSVIRSWLCELAARAFEQDGNDLEALEGYTEDSGEGRWTIEDATANDVPTPVITASLYTRLRSRGNGDFGDRVLAALRNQFGGHAVHAVPNSNRAAPAKAANRAAPAKAANRAAPAKDAKGAKRAAPSKAAKGAKAAKASKGAKAAKRAGGAKGAIAAKGAGRAKGAKGAGTRRRASHRAGAKAAGR